MLMGSWEAAQTLMGCDVAACDGRSGHSLAPLVPPVAEKSSQLLPWSCGCPAGLSHWRATVETMAGHRAEDCS